MHPSGVSPASGPLFSQAVAGLQVAVDDALFVRGSEGVQDLPGQFERSP